MLKSTKKAILKLAVIILVFIALILVLGPTVRLHYLARRCHFTDNLIGSIYSGACLFPNGRTFTFFGSSYSEVGGSMISGGYLEPEPSYGITQFRKKNTDEYLLFLEKEIGRDGNHAIFLVSDILKTPIIKSSERLMYGQYTCKFKGNFDNEIFAIVKDEQAYELVHIVKAWRANTTKGKFEEISTIGITCKRECVGDDCD